VADERGLNRKQSAVDWSARQCDGSAAPSFPSAGAPSLTLPPSDGLPQRRQQSASLAVKIPAASLPPVSGSVATARSASAVAAGAGSGSGSSPDLEKDTSGTTAVSVLLHHDTYTLFAANAGDSRAVLSTSSGAIVTLTNDHKADRPDEADRIRRAGGFVVHKRVMGNSASAGRWAVKMSGREEWRGRAGSSTTVW